MVEYITIASDNAYKANQIAIRAMKVKHPVLLNERNLAHTKMEEKEQKGNPD